MTTEEMKKYVLSNSSYDFLNLEPKLGTNIILLGFGGSVAYGTNTPESDIDVRGIALRSKEDIYLGRDFETFTNEATDTTIYSINRIFGLLADCNPNTIEMLGLRESEYIYVNEIVGRSIISSRKHFLSKKCINTFGGYATQQLYRLRQKTLAALSDEEYNAHIAKVISNMYDHLHERYGDLADGVKIFNTDSGLRADVSMTNVSLEEYYGINNEISSVIKEYNKSSKRNEHAIAHNKINKHAMHLLRLYMMAIDILEKQEIITYREDEHDLLMSIRNGEMSNESGMTDEFWKLLEEYEKRFDIAKANTKLPDKPDYDYLNKLLYYIIDTGIQREMYLDKETIETMRRMFTYESDN